MPNSKPQGTSPVRWFFRDPWRKLSSLLIAATIWVITYNQVTSGIEVSLRIFPQQGKPVMAAAGAFYLQNEIDDLGRPGEPPTMGRLVEISGHPVEEVGSIKMSIEGANETLATLGSLPSAWFQPGDMATYPREDVGSDRILVNVDPENKNRFGFYPPSKRLTVHFLAVVLTDGREFPIEELKLVYREMEPLSPQLDLRQVVKLGPYFGESYEFADITPRSIELLVPKGFTPTAGGWERYLFDPYEYPGPGLEAELRLPLRAEARKLPIVIQGLRNAEVSSIAVHFKLARKEKEKQPVWKTYAAGSIPVLYSFTYLAPDVAAKLLAQVEPISETELAMTIKYPEDPDWDDAKKASNLQSIQDLSQGIDVRLDLSEWLKYDENGLVMEETPAGRMPVFTDQSVSVAPKWDLTRKRIYAWPESWTEEIGGSEYFPKVIFNPEKVTFRVKKKED